jgi:DNA-binding NarL/FixJ family response regulator
MTAPTGTPIKIALVDDHMLFRKGMEAILRQHPDYEILTGCNDAAEFSAWLETAGTAPDILLLDLEMPGKNGVELADELRVSHPAIRIIVLSMHFRENLISNLVEKGVHSYLPKNAEPEELLAAIRIVHQNGFYFNDLVLKAIRKSITGGKKRAADSTLGYGITQRENEVLELICRELSTAEIADKLCISARTVDGHRNNLLQKSGALNTAGLVLFAVRNRIIDPWF